MSLPAPQTLARLSGWRVTLKELALRLRCLRRGKKLAELVAVARPRPMGVPKNPHRVLKRRGRKWAQADMPWRH